MPCTRSLTKSHLRHKFTYGMFRVGAGDLQLSPDMGVPQVDLVPPHDSTLREDAGREPGSTDPELGQDISSNSSKVRLKNFVFIFVGGEIQVRWAQHRVCLKQLRHIRIQYGRYASSKLKTFLNVCCAVEWRCMWGRMLVPKLLVQRRIHQDCLHVSCRGYRMMEFQITTRMKLEPCPVGLGRWQFGSGWTPFQVISYS